MKREVIERWQKALRDGGYVQDYGSLRPTPDTFCAIGVLCDISEHIEWTGENGDLAVVKGAPEHIPPTRTSLPFKAFPDLWGTIPVLMKDEGDGSREWDSIALMNDGEIAFKMDDSFETGFQPFKVEDPSRKSFEEIADFLDLVLEGKEVLADANGKPILIED